MKEKKIVDEIGRRMDKLKRQIGKVADKNDMARIGVLSARWWELESLIEFVRDNQ